MMILVLLISCALFLSLMVSVFVQSQIGNITTSEGFAIIGGEEYVMWDPIDGYRVTPGNVSDSTDDPPFLFTNSTHHDINAWLFRENLLSLSQNMIYLRMDWGWWSYDYASVSLDQIISDRVSGTNHSLSEFELKGERYTLYVSTGSEPEDHATLIWSNQYNISVAQSIESLTDALTMKASYWTMINQLLTAQLPYTTMAINYILTGIVWGMIAFIVVIMFSRFVPFIGGG